jgi:molybdopterin/thiamine biosynthesis adenylyltransferase
MNDQQLLRYSRHILLPEIDISGQQSLLNSHVLIVGLGGLGSPVALYLAAAGIGTLTLVDDDHVELSNLQRQVIHKESTITHEKVTSAKQAIDDINSEIQVHTVNYRLEREQLVELISTVDVVVDCTDNFAARFLLNDVTQYLKVPLVSGAAIRLEGQVTVYDARIESSACYRCVYEDTGEPLQTCSESGVLSPILGVIGSMQALETIKLITHMGESLAGRLMIFDGLSMSWREIRIKQDSNCPVCNR